MDVVGKEKRSQMMSNIKGKDTKPEIFVRKALHKRGFRYKLHDKQLPGKPDLVFPKYRAVIQVQGCFWHRHDCHLFKWPSTRKEFWREKIEGNVVRDHANLEKLRAAGWKAMIIWECALKGKTKLNSEMIIENIEKWLISDLNCDSIIKGNN